MKHLGTGIALVLTAPAALAWVPCEQKGLTPPVAIQREAPRYPESVREIGVEGFAEIALTVLRDGRVGWVDVIRAEPPGFFEQAAAQGARRWRFEPARDDGVPVECRLRTRVRFALVDTVATRPGSESDDGPSPVYPAALASERIEGYAEVEFELAPDGRVDNARVIAAMPRGEFERAALEAIRAWRGAPAASARRDTRRFVFRLPDSTLGTVPATMLGAAPFPMEACRRRVRGRVALEVRTDTAGRVSDARILSATPAGVFEETALAVARRSRLSPAYRDGLPIAATALLTLFFDPEKATCPGTHSPDRDAPRPYRPEPRVTQVLPNHFAKAHADTVKSPAAAATGCVRCSRPARSR